MQITITDGDDIARVALVGRLDIQGAEVISLPLARLAGGNKNIMIDMSEVSFLASIGIRHLVSTTKTLSRRGGRLVLVKPNDIVKEVLATAGLASMFVIVGSETEGLALLG